MGTSYLKYNVYGDDNRIIEANVTRADVCRITGYSDDYIRKRLEGLPRGLKEKIGGYTVECVLEREPTPNKEAEKLLISEWDEVCMPFRKRQLISRHQNGSAFR